MSTDTPPKAGIVAPSVAAESGKPGGPAFIAFLRSHSLATFFALVIVASLRIVSTYAVFSRTWDEANHVAAGTEWLTEGNMQLDHSHPPLARVAEALGPYLAAGRPRTLPPVDPALARLWDRGSVAGLAILHRDGRDERNLALARLGVLPFFWIASLTVYLWARRCLGEPAAAFAVFFFTFLPPVLAHAGLATTDMALTAFVGASLLATSFWIGKPSLPRSLLLGATYGLAVLSKFSALPFIPVALAAAFVWYIFAERPALRDLVPGRNYLAPLGIVSLTFFLVVWAGYRFSFGSMGSPGFLFPVPAPELFAGLRDLLVFNGEGHPSFVLGQYSTAGWWYFFPVVLAVKTPLPFLALMVFGAAAATRRNKAVWLGIASSLGILSFCMTSHINLGVRHILPVYMGFSIAAAAGAERLLALSSREKWTRWLLGMLAIWMAATSLLSHPDYLPYFNALAGNRPETVLVDSDLDWGQDMKRLARRLKELGAPSVTFTTYIPADLTAMGFPPILPDHVTESSPGWNAVSLTRLKILEGQGAFRGVEPWQERIAPRERIGKGMWLWYFPPNTGAGK